MRRRNRRHGQGGPPQHEAAAQKGDSKRNGRKPLISGNWKMHMDHFEAVQTLQRLHYALKPSVHDRVDVSVHPPFTSLRSVQTVLQADGMPVSLGAQHCGIDDSGPFTGEVSPAMLARLDVLYVIVGHSERRALFGEDDGLVNARARAVLRHGMTPIVCVGETEGQREAGDAEAVVSAQTAGALDGLDPAQVGGLVVAYEPVWAIGTGATATSADAQAMCALIRSQAEQGWGGAAARSLRIQYGGSVKPSNVSELMGQPDIDGALVGGASLDADQFARIVMHLDHPQRC